MSRLFLPLALAFVTALAAHDDPVTFKSNVELARVDAQVLDQGGRAITGLQATDFLLRVDGHVVPIRNFASENMPIDILFLLDVSGSMRPHVQRIDAAARQALDVLAPKDRVAIMVFDTYTRVRLAFSESHNEITSGLDRVLRSERFNGGTQITRAMLDAANYVQREARPEARRAIVILTDDETQDAEDEPRVESALRRANAVLSFLEAPYEPPTFNGGGRRRGPLGGGGGGWPGSGTGWPGGGTGWPGAGGGIGIPGRGGYGGGDRSHTAGTATIATDSGGDTMGVQEASALEDTLTRLRQRYTLNFYFPNGSPERASVRVELSPEAKLRFMAAEVHSRQVFISGGGSGEQAGPMVVSRSHPGDSATDAQPDEIPAATAPRPSGRSVAVNEDDGPVVNTVDANSGPGDSNPSTETAPKPAAQPANASQPSSRGWPHADQQPPSKPN